MTQTYQIANLSDINFGQLQGSMTGDVLGVLNGTNLATTIQPNVVTYGKFQQVAAASLVGNATGSLANAAGITLGATLAFSGSILQTAAGIGDVTWGANSFSTTIAANAVTYAKFQQVAASNLVGNPTGALANAQGITLGATLAFAGTALQTGAGTGDVTWAANSFTTTVSKLQGVTLSGATGTGNVVFSAGPTLTGTLTAAAITASGAITFSGLTTAGIVLNSAAGLLSTSTTLPAGTTATTQSAGDNSTKVSTTAYADANHLQLTAKTQSFSGGVRTPSAGLPTGNVTLDSGNGPLQSITNGGAFTITAPANDGTIILLITNNATAGAITFTGFTSEANHGDTIDTTNGHKFLVNVITNNGTSTYIAHALQ